MEGVAEDLLRVAEEIVAATPKVEYPDWEVSSVGIRGVDLQAFIPAKSDLWELANEDPRKAVARIKKDGERLASKVDKAIRPFRMVVSSMSPTMRNTSGWGFVAEVSMMFVRDDLGGMEVAEAVRKALR